MHISIEHHNDQFNICLHSQEGRDAFLVIKGCRLKDSEKGRFISFPARKLDSGKWWNHVYASEAFQGQILKALDASKPQAPQRTHAQMKRGSMDDDSDVPF